MSLPNVSSIQHICIYGIGGVGGYFGGKIAYEAQQQQDVNKHISFIARGEHLAEIQKHGLLLNSSEKQGMRCLPNLASDTIHDVPPLDLCLICVKGYDLENVVTSLAPYIKESTIIVPLLNGVDIYDRIRPQLSKGIVLPSCVYVRSYIEQPGVVAETGNGGKIVCGYDPSAADFDPSELLAFFEQMNIQCVWQDDPAPAIWEKYMFIASFGLMTTYSGKTLGKIVDSEEDTATTQAIMREILEISRKSGVNLPENVMESAFGTAKVFPYDTTTSYQRDVMAKGTKNEGDLFGGTIIRLGKKFGVPTPVTERIYTAIEERLQKTL